MAACICFASLVWLVVLDLVSKPYIHKYTKWMYLDMLTITFCNAMPKCQCSNYCMRLISFYITINTLLSSEESGYFAMATSRMLLENATCSCSIHNCKHELNLLTNPFSPILA